MKFTVRFLALFTGLVMLTQSADAQTKYYPSEFNAKDTPCYQAKPSKPAITRGSETCNSSTYYQRIGRILNIDFQDWSLSELAGHMGYVVTHAKRDLETIIPTATLNGAPSSLTAAQRYWIDRQNEATPSQRVLVSRFFAPKIVNYAVTKGQYTPGWRKLVYLPMRPGSAAEKEGVIAGAYILFNYFASDRKSDPYSANTVDGHAISQNNQVILVPADLSPQIKGQYRDSAFFAVYSGYKPGDDNNSYRLLNTLTAGFDIPPDGDVQAYAIPDACAQCHGHDNEFGRAVTASGDISMDPNGGVFPFVKPNYLDTDQWYDAQRLDYPDLIGVLEPVYDGGTDRSSPQYKRAMDVIFQLNSKMFAQGSIAKRPDVNGQAVDTFQQSAASTWLDLHATTSRTTVWPPEERFFSTKGSSLDKESGELQLAADHLSQFCFRCHSSIQFNVFDADYLKSSAGQNLSDYVPTMPLGRVLRGTEEACLKATLRYAATPTTINSRKIVESCGSSQLMKGVSAGPVGVCFAVLDGNLRPGGRIVQTQCRAQNIAESIWRHDPDTGMIHSTKRPDLCMGVAAEYINQATRTTSPTPISGGVQNYRFNPVTLHQCGAAAKDAIVQWEAVSLAKRHVFKAKRDPGLCLSGGDYTTAVTYAESCGIGNYVNGAYFIRTFEDTKTQALASISD